MIQFRNDILRNTDERLVLPMGMLVKKGRRYLLSNGEISHPVEYDFWSEYAVREFNEKDQMEHDLDTLPDCEPDPGEEDPS